MSIENPMGSDEIKRRVEAGREALKYMDEIVHEASTPQEKSDVPEQRIREGIISIARDRGLIGPNREWSEGFSATAVEYWKEALIEEGVLNDHDRKFGGGDSLIQTVLEKLNSESGRGEERKAA